MPIISHSRTQRQILENTRAIMAHLGIQEETILAHTKTLADHSERIAALESKLRELGRPFHGRTIVDSRDARRVADEAEMSIIELYRALRAAGLIIPGEDHSSQVQRVDGEIRRVVVLRKVGEGNG